MAGVTVSARNFRWIIGWTGFFQSDCNAPPMLGRPEISRWLMVEKRKCPLAVQQLHWGFV